MLRSRSVWALTLRPAPIAHEGLRLIRELYAIEADISGSDPEARLHTRQSRSASVMAQLHQWLTYNRARFSAKSNLGEAMAYLAKYWDGLQIFLTDGRVEIDNNPVERTIRPIALNRKNALFAGHDVGAQNWAIIASLIETCKLNKVDPFGWLSATLTAIVKGHTLDISVKETAVCVVNEAGQRIWEGGVPSTAEAIAAITTQKAPALVRAGMETGPQAVWLWHALRTKGSWLTAFTRDGPQPH